MSVTSVSRSFFVGHTYTQKNSENNIKIKKGYIWFNGYKIKIGNSLKETARNINKLYKSTGIKAYIIKDKKGYEKLILKVSGNILNINDPQGLLAELYQKGKIGKNKDSIIQVIRRLGGKEEVQINYNKIFPKKESYKLDKLKLSENNITYLAGYKLNVSKNIQTRIIELVANSTKFEETKTTDDFSEEDLNDSDFNISPESDKYITEVQKRIPFNKCKNSKIPRLKNSNSQSAASFRVSTYSSGKENITPSKTNTNRSNYKKPLTPRGYDKEHAERMRQIALLKDKFEKVINEERLNRGRISNKTMMNIKNSLPEVAQHFRNRYKLDL